MAGALSVTGMLAASVVAGGGAVASEPEVQAAGGAGTCSLADAEITATAHPARRYDDAFNDYGNTGKGWTGGDSTFSLPLPDADKGPGLGWFFSDTFLGPVNDDLTRPESTPFLNNSIVVQKPSGALRTVTGGTNAQPASVVPAEENGDWYWVGDPTYGKKREVQLPVLRFEKFGPGQFDFGWVSNSLALLDRETLQLKRLVDLPSDAGINWGSWTEARRSSTLVYGINDIEGVRSAFLAKVGGNDGLQGDWSFWSGSGWSESEADAAPVAEYVANEFSVSKYRDGWLMVTQDTSELFSTRVVAQVACSPTGPFEVAGELYRTPETGATGTYENPNVFTYNAHEHPELRRGNRLLVTHNVNSFVGDDLYDDVTIYRPRFWSVTLHVEG